MYYLDSDREAPLRASLPGLQLTNPPRPEKAAVSFKTTFIKETSVKLSTGDLKAQTKWITTLSILTFDPWRLRTLKLSSSRERQLKIYNVTAMRVRAFVTYLYVFMISLLLLGVCVALNGQVFNACTANVNVRVTSIKRCRSPEN